MSNTETLITRKSRTVMDGIVETRERGLVVLSPAERRPIRRVVYLDNYGGASMWQKIKTGQVPVHHLRGCPQLVRLGYQVALAEPLPDFTPRRPLPHDLSLFRFVRSWLGKDGIVYCGHNVLFWIPLLRLLRAVRCHVVSHLFAVEPLDWSQSHSGIIALTPAAAEQAKRLAPGAKVAHLGWGVELDSFPILPYDPQWLLHCGIAGRDFHTLSQAAALSAARIRVVCPGLDNQPVWPSNVQLIDGGRGYNFQDKKVSYHELLHRHYARSAGSLIITISDPGNGNAFGCTNIIEAMAMSQPIILTRAGALPAEVRVEQRGFGLEVPEQEPHALAEAMTFIANNPARAEAMGRIARRLCESHYNIKRYAVELHNFFESL